MNTPNETFLFEYLLLESSSNVNSSIILHPVDDALRQLGTKRENFALLLTNAAHLLHNCAMLFRAFFKNIDDAVASIKAATNKNKDRKNDFREAGLPLSPVSVIMR